MFTKDAIESLQYGGGILEASTAVGRAFSENTLVSLPDHFKLHDLEQYLPNRRRSRGTMETNSVASFAKYVQDNLELGASIFVSPAMVANAVLNLGTPEIPGHADNRAQFKPRATAAYNALRKIASGGQITQQLAAEYIEDWQDLIECFHEGDRMTNAKAISAVRNITIDAMRKVEASEQQLSASRSAFEQVTASSKDTLPTHIYVTCPPYADFGARVFVLRLGIITSDKPAITLRIQAMEKHEEEMATELVEKVREHLPNANVLIGDYVSK